MEVVPVQHDAEVRHRHVVAVDLVVVVGGPGRGEVGDDLVAEEVEVDPLGAGPAFRTAQQAAVERARRGEVVDREGEVEGGDAGHGWGSVKAGSIGSGRRRLPPPAARA